MFRKLLLPLAATALLAGCVTSAPYGYRDGAQGDYYYGAPSVEYRYRGAYGDPYYGPYRPGFSLYGSYGYPYGRSYYGNPYYGNPYYRYPYGYPYGYPRPVYRPRPDGNHSNRPDGGPWRNLEDVVRRRRGMEGTPQGSPTPSMPQIARPEPGSFGPAARPRAGGDEGSAVGGMIRRARRANAQEE